MQGSLFKKIATVIVFVLLIVFSRPIFRLLSKYYLKSPTILILALVGIIVLIYVIVFFKEIFLRRRGR
jgi:hypothetical protein